MRPRLLTAAVAAATLLCFAAPAAASPNGRAFFERLGSDDAMRFQADITENSAQFLRLMLDPGGPPFTNVYEITPGACTVQDDHIAECAFDAPAGAGQKLEVGIRTSGRYPDGLGGEVELCFDPSCSPGFKRAIPVTGPGSTPPPGGDPPPQEPPPSGPSQSPFDAGVCPVDLQPRPCADVVAVGVRAHSASDSDIERLSRLARELVSFVFLMTVRNDGLDTAEDVFLNFDVPGTDRWAWIVEDCRHTYGGPIALDRSGMPANCELRSESGGMSSSFSLAPGESITVPGQIVLDTEVGELMFGGIARAGSATRDPVPGNNATALVAEAAGVVPDSVISSVRLPRARSGGRARASAAARPRVAGRATGAKRVMVAIARRSGAVRVAARSGCRWLKSPRRAHFATERGRRCDEAVWLRARGKRRWSLPLPRRLPRGRYEILARAEAQKGLAEASFSRADRNRRSVRVR